MTKRRLALLKYKYSIYKQMAAIKELYKFKHKNDHSWYRMAQLENRKLINIIDNKLREEEAND